MMEGGMTGACSALEGDKNTYKILVGKPAEKEPGG
jgi:hypothetical protein